MNFTWVCQFQLDVLGCVATRVSYDDRRKALSYVFA